MASIVTLLLGYFFSPGLGMLVYFLANVKALLLY